MAIGVTPKLQTIETYHYITEMDNEDDIETSDIEDSRATYSHINLDIGASMRLGEHNQWMVGVVAKNLISKDFDLSDAPVRGSSNNLVVEGGTVSLKPQFRAGVSYSNNWLINSSGVAPTTIQSRSLIGILSNRSRTAPPTK